MKTNMLRIICCIFSVLIMVSLITSCNGKSEEQAEIPSKEEIINGMFNALSEIKTSQFDMNMTVEMSGEVKGTASEVTMMMNFYGVMDYQSKKMKADITINTVTPNTEENKTMVTMYSIDDTVYILPEVPGTAPSWIKTDSSTAGWDNMNQVKSQIELLQGARFEITGSESINGKDCHLLQLEPDINQLWHTTMQQTGITGQEIPEIEKESLKEMLDYLSVKQWVAKDTYFLNKAKIEMNLEATPEELGSSNAEGIVKISISMDLFMHDYNQPVSIILPPEAEKAIEIPSNRP